MHKVRVTNLLHKITNLRSAWRLLAVLALSLAPAIPQMASAASPHNVTLGNDHQVRTWTGTVDSDGPRHPNFPECVSVSCDKLALDINLPNSTLHKDGNVVVAIRFINGTPDDSLQLAVYNDHGVRVGSSAAAVGTAQAVALPLSNHLNGTYKVLVVDGIAYGNSAPSPSISYEGLTQVQYAPAKQPLRSLLPDLIALPQTNVTLDAPFEIFNDPVPADSNCHQSEIDENSAHDCLRFDQNLANVGDGALDIRFQKPTGTTPTDGQQYPVKQRIYKSDGSFSDVAAGSVEWHAIHQHYHFEGFAQSKLWATNASGNRQGTAPVSTGDKVSFCIADTNINPTYWGTKPFSAQNYPAPTCLTPYGTSGGNDLFKQGMSAGWTDEYNWFLPGQYIEVSNVPNGDYILDTTVDPTSRLQEKSKTNNCGSVRVRLTNMGTPTKHAELLGAGPACTL
jgi:hypothetical protein